VGGVATPTEASVLAVLYTLVVGLFVLPVHQPEGAPGRVLRDGAPGVDLSLLHRDRVGFRLPAGVLTGFRSS